MGQPMQLMLLDLVIALQETTNDDDLLALVAADLINRGIVKLAGTFRGLVPPIDFRVGVLPREGCPDRRM